MSDPMADSDAGTYESFDLFGYCAGQLVWSSGPVDDASISS